MSLNYSKYIKPMEKIAGSFPETKGHLVYEMKNVDQMISSKRYSTFDIVKCVANGKTLAEEHFDPTCKYVAIARDGSFWVSLKDDNEKYHWLLWLLRYKLEKKLDDVWDFMDKTFGDKAQEYYDVMFPEHEHA